MFAKPTSVFHGAPVKEEHLAKDEALQQAVGLGVDRRPGHLEDAGENVTAGNWLEAVE